MKKHLLIASVLWGAISLSGCSKSEDKKSDSSVKPSARWLVDYEKICRGTTPAGTSLASNIWYTALQESPSGLTTAIYVRFSKNQMRAALSMGIGNDIKSGSASARASFSRSAIQIESSDSARVSFKMPNGEVRKSEIEFKPGGKVIYRLFGPCLVLKGRGAPMILVPLQK